MFYLKRGDTEPNLPITLTDGTEPVDLTGAQKVRVLAKQGSDLLIDRTVTGGSDGTISMPWQAGDTDTPGLLLIEVEVTWATGEVQTFPPDEYLRVTIVPDLG